MSRLLIGLFVVVGLSVAVAILILPLMLSGGNASQENYLTEMAAWHVSWQDSSSTDERRDLLPALDAVRLPIGSDSIEMLDRHRIYKQAHIIYSQAQDLSANALVNVSALVAVSGFDNEITCSNIEALLEGEFVNDLTVVEVNRAVETCDLFASANRNLVIVRTQASLEWLEDELNAIDR